MAAQSAARRARGQLRRGTGVMRAVGEVRSVMENGEDHRWLGPLARTGCCIDYVRDLIRRDQDRLAKL